MSYVVSTAQIMCPFGTAPSVLNVTSQQKVLIEGKPVATVMDAQPVSNISPFAMCTTMTNPQVAAATAAALGVFTPAPCMPVTASWIPGQKASRVIDNKPCLTNDCQCMCAYGGTITITNPGQVKVN